MADEGPTTGFLQQLRQRKLAQWTLAYAAGAWVLLQVLGLAADSYELPRIVMRLAIGVVVLGFVATLVLAWYHGERGQQKVGGTELLILALLFTVGGGVLWTVERRVGGAVPGDAPAAVARVAVAANDKSIAVLPFANLSSDPDNAYFAEGIQDEILTRLAKIGDLKVISRTSTLRYASAPDNLPEIARQLGVANIVEGSVQKVGNSVRINVQLIRADTDQHLWAEIYDRKLDDIFSIQSEVAGAIAQALQARLTREEQRAVALKPTDNPAAYDAYLRGLALEVRDIYSTDTRVRARDQFAEATRLDPDFVEAWAHQVAVQSFLYFNDVEHTPQALETMRRIVADIARLRPDSGEAWLAQGYYRYRGLYDLPAAIEAFEAAARRLPNNAAVLSSLGFVERRLGRMDAAMAHLRQAELVDPVNPNYAAVIGEIALALRRFPEAHAAYDRALALSETDISIVAGKVYTYQAEGNLDAADALLAGREISDGYDRVGLAAQIDQLLLRRRYDEIIARIAPIQARPLGANEAPSTHLLTGLWLANAMRHKGDAAGARATYLRLLPQARALERAGADPGNIAYVLTAIHMGLGDHPAALREVERALVLSKSDAKSVPLLQQWRALIHARAGDRDTALAQLAPLLEVPYGTTPALLRLDPEWDVMRDDPRFVALTRTGGAPGKGVGAD